MSTPPTTSTTAERDGLHCVYGECQGLPRNPRPCHPGCSFTMRATVGPFTPGWTPPVQYVGPSVECWKCKAIRPAASYRNIAATVAAATPSVFVPLCPECTNGLSI